MGARPKGPRPGLKDGPQKALLTRLHDLNDPYRVSYETVARQLWSGHGPTNVQRSRTRDLSRQFRGEKTIEWRVVEIYVDLLFSTADPARATELANLRELYGRAFGMAADRASAPVAAPAAVSVDRAYVAELERLLDEARTRASFATALLVVVQADNAALRGLISSYDWFARPPLRAGTTEATAHKSIPRPRAGIRTATATEPGTGDADASRPGDPATTPILRLQDYRAAQRRHQAASRAALADAFPPSTRASVGTATLPAAPLWTQAALARARKASRSRRAESLPGPPLDDTSQDILASGEKRARAARKS